MTPAGIAEQAEADESHDEDCDKRSDLGTPPAKVLEHDATLGVWNQCPGSRVEHNHRPPDNERGKGKDDASGRGRHADARAHAAEHAAKNAIVAAHDSPRPNGCEEGCLASWFGA